MASESQEVASAVNTDVYWAEYGIVCYLCQEIRTFAFKFTITISLTE